MCAPSPRCISLSHSIVFLTYLELFFLVCCNETKAKTPAGIPLLVRVSECYAITFFFFLLFFFTESAKVNLVRGLLTGERLNGSPCHCASCLFLVQTALLAKPLLPHHGPLTFGNTLTVKSLPLLVRANSHEHQAGEVVGVFFFFSPSKWSLEVGVDIFLRFHHHRCQMEYVVARRQMINQIPHPGFSEISIFVAAISQASGICFRGFGGL